MTASQELANSTVNTAAPYEDENTGAPHEHTDISDPDEERNLQTLYQDGNSAAPLEVFLERIRSSASSKYQGHH